MINDLVKRLAISRKASGFGWDFWVILYVYMSMLLFGFFVLLFGTALPVAGFGYMAEYLFFPQGLTVRQQNSILSFGMIAGLIVLGVMKRHYLFEARDFEQGAQGQLARWMNRNAWVGAWIFLFLALIAEQVLFRFSPAEHHFEAEQSLLFMLDNLAGAIFFDLFDVFQIHMSEIRADTTIARLFSLLARTAVSIFIVSFVARVHEILKIHDNNKMQNNMGDFGFLAIGVLFTTVNLIVIPLWFLLVVVPFIIFW